MLQDVAGGVGDTICSKSFVQNAQFFNVSGIFQSGFDGNINSIYQRASKTTTRASPCSS